MKNAFRIISLVLCTVMFVGALASCGLRPFENDLRYRYDYDLTDYLKSGKYKGLEVYVGDTGVSDEEMNNLIKRNSVLSYDWEDIFDRPCKEGDIVGVSYQGYTKGESGEFDVPIAELSKGYRLGEPTDTPEALSESSSTTLSIVLGADELFPGFDAQITGAFSVGDRKTLTYTLPEPCWLYPELSGKEIKMDVLLTYIQEIKYPENSDQFANDAGFESAEDYKLAMGSKMLKEREEQVEEYVHNRVWAKINENFTVKSYPEKELAETLEVIKKSYETAAERQKVTLDEYIKDYLGLTDEQFSARVEDEAKQSVKDEMIVYYIARKEKIGVSNLDFEDKVEEMMEEEDFSSIDQYILYMAYYNGYIESGDSPTEEALEHARNFIKETILYNAVDKLVDENTTRKTSK